MNFNAANQLDNIAGSLENLPSMCPKPQPPVQYVPPEMAINPTLIEHMAKALAMLCRLEAERQRSSNLANLESFLRGAIMEIQK